MKRRRRLCGSASIASTGLLTASHTINSDLRKSRIVEENWLAYQEMSEQKWTVVIGRHRHFQAILGYHLPERLCGPRVVDQHVQPTLLAIYLLRELSDRGQRGEVQFSDHDVLVLRFLRELLCETVFLLFVRRSMTVRQLPPAGNLRLFNANVVTDSRKSGNITSIVNANQSVMCKISVAVY